MRKILLATTALVGVALSTASAYADQPSSPITVNVGGYVDAVAGWNREGLGAFNTGNGTAFANQGHDFETEFKLNIDAIGHAANGIQYGANIGLWNGPEVTNLWTGGANTIELNSAYVWLSGSFGKVLFGDEHGASDLFVYAPTVGEGQVDGRYQDFVSPFVIARFQPSGIDNTEHSTKITYYTPKVGNENNKVQAGISYAPQMYDYGQQVDYTNDGATAPAIGGLNGPASPYQDLLKGAIQYTGNFHPVALTVAAQALHGSAQNTAGATPYMFANAPITTGDASKFQSFTAYGLGTQVAFEGFTVGGSFMDNGSYGAVQGQNHDQHTWTLGGKYEFNKISVGASWLNGKGYENLLAGSNGSQGADNTNYVDSFNAYSVGATYTWFPGLTTAADGTIFQQNVRDETGHEDGYVFLVSQKLTF